MLKKLLKNIKLDKKESKNLPWLLGLLCLGIGILIFSSFLNKENKTTLNNETEKVSPEEIKPDASTIKKYEKEYEIQLMDVLSKIVGVDDVTIMVNLDSDEVMEFASETIESSNTTNDLMKGGGNRSVNQSNVNKKIAHYRNNNSDLPVIVKRIKPKVRGVLVVARGVENLQVKAIVLEAIQRSLDVPLHRVSVLPKGN